MIEYRRKFRYSMHVDSLLKSKHLIDAEIPMMHKRLP